MQIPASTFPCYAIEARSSKSDSRSECSQSFMCDHKKKSTEQFEMSFNCSHGEIS